MAKRMNDEETVRFFRAILRRKKFHPVVNKRKGGDRRMAFFSYISCDQRVNIDRRQQHI